MDDILDISEIKLGESSGKTNFGSGIELLMNDKKAPDSSDSNKMDDIDNLEHELNDLSDIVGGPSRINKSDLFTGPSTLPSGDNLSVKFDSAPPAMDEPTIKLNFGGDDEENKTWDGYTKFNDVPIYPDKQGPPQMNKEELLREKFKFLRKLEALEQKGVNLSKKYSMDSPLNEMQGEYETIVEEKAKTNSVKFQGNMLMACINGIEFLNGRFDPFDVKLDGWSDQVNENLTDYDDVFGELYEKYKSKGSMSPELKLLFQLGGSAVMVHMTNTLFKSAMPGMDDILRQNPDLMQQFQSAAVNSMGQSNPGLSGFMGMMNEPPRSNNMGSAGPPPPMATQGPGAAAPPSRAGNNSYGQTPQPERSMGRSSVATDRINVTERQEPQQSSRSARPEMRGPADISNILSGLKTKTIDIQQEQPPIRQTSPVNNNESSTISISDLKDLQASDSTLPKRTKRRQGSAKNTVSLDI